MDDHETVHLAIDPPGVPDASIAARVAAIIDKHPYDTRVLLAGKLPRIVAHYDGIEKARSAVQTLRDLGLVAVLCTDSELRRPVQPFRPHTMEFGRDEVIFRREGEKDRAVRQDEVFLILTGAKRTSTKTESTSTTMKLSLPATMLTGGIPIWRNVKAKTSQESLEAEHFVRLHDRKSSEPIIEILQHDVDYSFLETDMAPASLANLGIVVDRIASMFPHAVFDDRLTRHPGSGEPTSRLLDDLEVNCRLVYLCHVSRTGVVGDA